MPYSESHGCSSDSDTKPMPKLKPARPAGGTNGCGVHAVGSLMSIVSSESSWYCSHAIPSRLTPIENRLGKPQLGTVETSTTSSKSREVGSNLQSSPNSVTTWIDSVLSAHGHSVGMMPRSTSGTSTSK